ncbi:twin-arginine translocation pathway signal [Nocardia higoensis]|uniref:twin-arginine translocation pathway signal n=1 Tax=Nocardia higoensis TaxID=228599 RepID=UPI0002E29A34|nr:twin-arginine translocation pathway signal [Nocardia higoensis]
MTTTSTLLSGPRRAFGILRAERGFAILTILAVASAALAVTLWATQYRTDSHVDDAAARTAVEAATTGTVALLSYTPDTIDADFASAKTHLTGDFLAYYSQFTQQVVAPAAKEKSVSTDAAVVRSAVAELTPDQAVVLVFINQTTTSAEKPDPALTASSVRVTLTKVDDAWRISRFEPI